MNTGLIFQDNPLFFLKRIFMLESQKMLPSRQQAFCFFACLPEREHINVQYGGLLANMLEAARKAAANAML